MATKTGNRYTTGTTTVRMTILTANLGFSTTFSARKLIPGDCDKTYNRKWQYRRFGRGGFRHVQHVRPNRGPHKNGAPTWGPKKFLQHWYWSQSLYDITLLPARRYASAGLCDSDVSVCPSVRPSHAGIVPSTAKAGSWNVHHLIAPSLSFLARYDLSKNSQGVTPKERAKWGWVGFFRRFSTNMSSYLENGAF